ncbi:MAG: hypothetical protein JRE28_01160 [Deltaproteobacteria bacterium]|nr:hypothetical protein [Deltaproteobacteria bacterium]
MDRDSTGVMVSAELNALPGCFQDNVDTTGDCKLIATCLDLNFPTILSLDTTDGKLKLVPTVLGVQSLPRDEGQTCEGGFNFGGDFNTISESSSSSAIDDLEANVNKLSPALQSDGLDLGNVVVFKDPELFAIDTSDGIPGAESDFQDYLGIRGMIAEPSSP